MYELTDKAGAGCANVAPDVDEVQKRLKAKSALTGIEVGCGPSTIAAIKRFQSTFMHHPDGEVWPKGTTWKKLNGQEPAGAAEAIPFRVLKPKPDSASFNVGLKRLTNAFMLRAFGEPRTERDYTDKDAPVTNPLLKRNMLFQSVGPFRVTGLKPAVLSLTKIMADIAAEQPDVYRVLDSRGMLVVRWVRPADRGSPEELARQPRLRQCVDAHRPFTTRRTSCKFAICFLK
jgi:hypothetical protein